MQKFNIGVPVEMYISAKNGEHILKMSVVGICIPEKDPRQLTLEAVFEDKEDGGYNLFTRANRIKLFRTWVKFNFL